MNKDRGILKFLQAFGLFFLLCGFVVTCSFLLFFNYTAPPAEQVRQAAIFTFANVLILTLLFAALLPALHRSKLVPWKPEGGKLPW